MSAVRISAFLAAATIIGIGAVACGDDNNDNGNTVTPAVTRAVPSPAGTAAATPTRSAAATPAATVPGGTEGGTTITVRASGIKFDKDEIDATVGQPLTVALENADQVPHTFTVYADEAYTTPVAGADTGRVSAGASGQFVVTLSEAKDYYFRCEVHPSQMQGEIHAS